MGTAVAWGFAYAPKRARTQVQILVTVGTVLLLGALTVAQTVALTT